MILLGPVLFDEAPPGPQRARAVVAVGALLAGALLALEWLGVH